MSANWKLWLLSSGVVCGLACSDSGAGGSIDDGGDSDAVSDEGKDSSVKSPDGGSLDASRRDGSVRRDGSTFPAGDGGDNDPGCGVLVAKIRDFKSYSSSDPTTNQDFETYSGSGATTGLLESMLDSQHLPVFKEIKNGQLTSKATFDQWYRDVPGTNQTLSFSIPNMAADPKKNYEFESSEFFPADGKGFGNTPGQSHNFSFTTQIVANFTYYGGEVFTFRGDDDLWIFVNDRLALDLGGLHSALPGTIDFDSQAAALGIVKGKTYRMDIFHAERHTTASNFKFSTTIACFMVPPIYI
jgi:fibro-slime domain-containing protein